MSSIVKSSTTNYGLDAWKCEWEMTMETFHNDLGCRFTSPKNIEWYKLVKAQKETLLNFWRMVKIFLIERDLKSYKWPRGESLVVVYLTNHGHKKSKGNMLLSIEIQMLVLKLVSRLGKK